MLNKLISQAPAFARVEPAYHSADDLVLRVSDGSAQHGAWQGRIVPNGVRLLVFLRQLGVDVAALPSTDARRA